MNKKIIWRNLLIALIALVPCLICLWFINTYAVNVLVFDGWGQMTCWMKLNEYQLTFADLFAQHNEHRIFFVRPVYLGLLWMSNFNSIVPMRFSLLIVLLMFFLLSRYIISRNSISDRRKYVFMALISFLLFSLTQEENLLWDFQVGFFMVLFFSVLSCYFLYRMCFATRSKTRNIYFIIALLSAVIDSFSSIQGLVMWITGVVMLFVMFRKKTFSSPYFIVWTLMAVATWIAYFTDYTKPGYHPSLTYLFDNPGTFINYFFSIIGNAISGNFKTGATVIGIALMIFFLIACVKIWKNKQVQQFIFPLALVLNNLFVLGSIAVGRAGFGAEQALASRYTSFAICLVVGVLLLWMELKDKHKKKAVIKNMTILFVTMVVISIPVTMSEGLHAGKWRKEYMSHSAYLLETARMQPDQFLARFYGTPDFVQKIVTYMERKKYNVFRDPQYAVPELLRNDSLGTLNNEVLQFAQNTIQLAPDFMVVVRPVVHPKYKNEVKALYADISGQLFPLYYRAELNNRPPNPASINDISAISNRVLSKGIHTIKFKALRHDNAGYYVIDPKWVFEIK